MPTLQSLPIELQLLIISNIHLDDIEEFTLCCKALHRLSKDKLMEQYARRRRYSTIAVGHIDNRIWDEDQQVRGVHPILVLRDLLADPQSCLYTKTLVIGTLDDYSPEDFNDQEEAELDEVELGDVVAELKPYTRLLKKIMEVQRCVFSEIRETDLRRCPKAQEWSEMVLAKHMGPSASLLVAMLPNVQKLRLVDGFRDVEDSAFLTFLENYVSIAVSDRRSLRGLNTFSNLTEVGMHGLDDGCGANYEVFKGFMALPSMRTIKGRAIDGQYGFIEPSIVTSLEFYESAIEADSFSDTISAIEGLQKFVYGFWAGASMDDMVWQPREVVKALEKYTRKTLKQLELTGIVDTEVDFIDDFAVVNLDKGEPFIGSLCKFEVLEKIRLETMMLYKEIKAAKSSTPEEKSPNQPNGGGHVPDRVEKKWERGGGVLVEPERLVDILPISTRRLRLAGGLSDEDFTAMLEDLPALKGGRLPNLSSIYFEDVERREVDEEVVRKCEDAVLARLAEGDQVNGTDRPTECT